MAAEDKKNRPTAAATPASDPAPEKATERPEKPNLTRQMVELHIHHQLVAAGKPHEEAALVAKQRAAAIFRA